MLIGVDHFGRKAVFNNRLSHLSYDKAEIYDGIIDQFYIDEDITIPYSLEKPLYWRYNTVINAKFQGNLEGGSVEANNVQIEKIRFQKRKWDELEWHDVAEVPYNPADKLFYEAIDKYVANDFIYQYSIIPLTSSILGNRVVSDEVTARFDGVFLSDKNNNYSLLYDLELSDIENNISNHIFEPRNAQYPIVVHSNLDYSSFDVTATFITAETINSGEVNIRMERLGKDALLRFMKNGKPKVYRNQNGDLKLVTVVGKPREIPFDNISGIAKLSFTLVEIGPMDTETLRANGMLEGLTEVF